MPAKLDEMRLNSLVVELFNKSALPAMKLSEAPHPEIGGKKEFHLVLEVWKIFGLGLWEDKLIEGILKAYSFHMQDNIQGSFLIAYPKRLKRRTLIKAEVLSTIKVKFYYLRQAQVVYAQLHSINELPEVLQHLSKNSESQLDINIIIETFRQAVSLLEQSFAAGKINHLFMNQLFAETSEIKAAHVLSSTAYFLLNQLIFYHILASSNQFKNQLNPLNPALSSPEMLITQYFNNAIKVTHNYRAIFNVSLAQIIQHIEPLRQIITLIHAFALETIQGDYLGKIFHQLIPIQLRKKVASYYTLDTAAKLLAKLTIRHSDIKVLDPACGSGTLLLAAYSQKRALLEQKRSFTPEDHKLFLGEHLLGIDIMPFAAHLATINLALTDPSYFTNTIQIASADSNDLTNVSMVDLDGTLQPSFELTPPDIILMNPPFTKKQRLAIDNTNINYRQKLRNSLNYYYQHEILTGKSPYHAHFVCLADQLLGSISADKTPKFLGIVLPITFLRSESEINLRSYLITHYWIRYIIVREDKSNFSEETDLREVLVILEKLSSNTSASNRLVTYVFIQQFMDATTDQIGDVLLSLEIQDLPPHKIQPFANFFMLRIPQNELTSRNLFLPIALFSPNYDFLRTWLEIRTQPPFLALHDISYLQIYSKNQPEPHYINIKFKETFLLRPEFVKDQYDLTIVRETKDQWIVERGTKNGLEELTIPKKACRKGLRYISKKSIMDLSNLTEFVIDKPQPSISPSGNWQTWAIFLNDRTAYLALADRINFIRPGFSHLAFFSSSPMVIARTCAALKGLSPPHAKLAALWFNSTLGFLEWFTFRSPQQFSYCQHHKTTLEELVILDWNQLSLEEKAQLEILFQKVGTQPFLPFWQQFVQLFPPDQFSHWNSVISHFDLQNYLQRDFSPRKELDYFILKIILSHLDPVKRVQFIKSLAGEDLSHNDFTTLNDIPDELITHLLTGLYRCAGRIILYCLAADDKNFSA